jgi:hypothetical protein
LLEGKILLLQSGDLGLKLFDEFFVFPDGGDGRQVAKSRLFPHSLLHLQIDACCFLLQIEYVFLQLLVVDEQFVQLLFVLSKVIF